MRAAIYLRRSTNDELQADSLIIQEEVIRAYADANSYSIDQSDVYRESASGRTAEDRAEFSRLIRTVTSRAASFEVILVRDVSRWGRFDNADEAAYYEFLCLRHGVEVVYVDEPFGAGATSYGSLMKTMKRVLAAEFSREKSRIVTRGKRRAAELGFRVGAPPPYGMRRILVRPNGEFVQNLEPGIHKAVSCLKTKLAPAEDRTASIVAQIFNMFAREQKGLAEIARVLNHSSVPSPGGRQWSVCAVEYILRNPAYAGVASHHSSDSEGPPTSVREAYEAIVAFELYQAAQERFQDARRETATAVHLKLLAEAAEAEQRAGHLPAELIDQLASSEARLGRPERSATASVLERHHSDPLKAERFRLRDLLSKHFAITDCEEGYCLDGVLTVGLVVGWQRYDLPRAPVEFDLRGTSADFIVALGCCGSEDFKIIIRCTVTKNATRRLYLRHIHTISDNLPVFETDLHLIRRIRGRIFAGNSRAEPLLISAAQNKDFVNYASLARELRWPLSAVRLGIRNALARGEALPPLLAEKQTRVQVRCNCGNVRELMPSDAAQRKSSMCGACSRARGGPKKVKVCCPCGKERHIWPSAFKKLRGGVTALCHDCSLAKGREITLARNHARAAIVRAKHRLLRDIALLVLRLMRQRTGEFARPTLWSAGRRRLATLRWRNPIRNVHEQLTLDCSDAFVKASVGVPKEPVRRSLAERILDRTLWCARPPTIRTESVWIVLLGSRQDGRTTLL